MIKSWRHKGLQELYAGKKPKSVAPDMQKRVLRRLDALNVAKSPSQMDIPGFNFHALKGHQNRFTVAVNGPWRVTFGWDGNDAIDVDLEQYH